MSRTALVLVIGLCAAGCSDDAGGVLDTVGDGSLSCPTPDTPAPVALEPGVIVDSGDEGADHMVCDPGYPSSPPVSGSHFEAWQNCGFYTAAVRDHTAVHALEHGAVWIAYAPGAEQATLDAIAATVESTGHLLAAPYPELANPIVLTAWRRQLAVDTWDDPLVAKFIGDFAGRASPTAPEAGAACDGAVGTPPADPDAGYDSILADALSG